MLASLTGVCGKVTYKVDKSIRVELWENESLKNTIYAIAGDTINFNMSFDNKVFIYEE